MENYIFAIIGVISAAVLAVLVERLVEFVLGKFEIEIEANHRRRAAFITVIFVIIILTLGLFVIRGEGAIQQIFQPNVSSSVPTATPIAADAYLRYLQDTGTEVARQLTALAPPLQATPDTEIIALRSTGTAIARELQIRKATQTAVARFIGKPIKGVINPQFPGYINIRSYPSLGTDSNVLGQAQAGDEVVVTGWTNAPWIWYRIDMPAKNLQNIWISGIAIINNKRYDIIKFKDNNEPPQELYIKVK